MFTFQMIHNIIQTHSRILFTPWCELILDLAIFRRDTLLRIEILEIIGEDLRKIPTGQELNQMVK